jgi:hypothetical protein
MPALRAQQVGHRAAAPVLRQGRAARTPRCAPRVGSEAAPGASHAELRATGMDGPVGAAAPCRASEPGAGAR